MPFLLLHHADTVLQQGGQMPSVTESGWPALSSTTKKRRRDDDNNNNSSEVQTSVATTTQSLSSESQNLPSSTINSSSNSERLIFPSATPRGPPTTTSTTTTSLYNVSRKIIPLPPNKRFRLADAAENESRAHTHPSCILPSGHASPHHPQQQSHFSHAHPSYSTSPPISPQIAPRHDDPMRPGVSRTSSAALLAPCHICHRKPTRKSNLDSFADCTGCGQRTCFVCIRACPGWLPSLPDREQQGLSTSLTMCDVDDDDDPQKKGEGGGGGGGGGEGWSGQGHREVVCSRCCVERGTEGDVVCLGCLAGMEGA
ncbi:hypothetical protein F5B20DRAFT_528953 [Whalleya microplaca]|nr:hypothetical protein F5B20DRAFT_528953 [Whalleya microplaca]